MIWTGWCIHIEKVRPKKWKSSGPPYVYPLLTGCWCSEAAECHKNMKRGLLIVTNFFVGGHHFYGWSLAHIYIKESSDCFFYSKILQAQIKQNILCFEVKKIQRKFLSNFRRTTYLFSRYLAFELLQKLLVSFCPAFHAWHRKLQH